MTIRVDTKGKIFTHVISKTETPALIQTVTHLIHGHIHTHPEHRPLDELNQPDQFLAVTNAVVMGLDGQELHRADFLTLNKSQIVWLFPQDEDRTAQTEYDHDDQ